MNRPNLAFRCAHDFPKRERVSVLCICLLAVAICIGACAPGESERQNGITDDVDRVVELEAPARRIVSLSPATTELLFAIGAGELMVGRTRWAEYPPAALDVTDIGDGLNPNVELIAAQRPDLVVFYASPSNAQPIELLDRLGVASVSLYMDRLSHLLRAARLLGVLSDRRARADSMADAFESQLDSALGTSEARDGPSVVILSWDNPPIIIGAASFLSQLVELAGGSNVFYDVDRPSATVTIETIVERDPDLVLLVGSNGLPEFAERPEWQVVKAVRERRFVRVEGSEFSWPTFRAFEAVRRLRTALASARQ